MAGGGYFIAWLKMAYQCPRCCPKVQPSVRSRASADMSAYVCLSASVDGLFTISNVQDGALVAYAEIVYQSRAREGLPTWPAGIAVSLSEKQIVTFASPDRKGEVVLHLDAVGELGVEGRPGNMACAASRLLSLRGTMELCADRTLSLHFSPSDSYMTEVSRRDCPESTLSRKSWRKPSLDGIIACEGPVQDPNRYIGLQVRAGNSEVHLNTSFVTAILHGTSLITIPSGDCGTVEARGEDGYAIATVDYSPQRPPRAIRLCSDELSTFTGIDFVHVLDFSWIG